MIVVKKVCTSFDFQDKGSSKLIQFLYILNLQDKGERAHFDISFMLNRSQILDLLSKIVRVSPNFLNMLSE